jgi:glucan phosphorylase
MGDEMMTDTEQAAYDAAQKEIDKLKAEVIYWREMAEWLMKATMNIANVADLMFGYEKPELF